MKSLDRKLVRDLWHLRGQVFATALVIACGVASFVAMRSTYESLVSSRDRYYSEYRFADVFAALRRAPDTAAYELEAIPGVAQVQTRIAANVTLDLPDLPEPAQGRVVSVAEDIPAALNRLFLLRGRMLEPGRGNEVIISGAFADANRLQPGDKLNAVLNSRLEQLNIVGVALSPEYIYEIRPGDIFPDNRRFGILWMNRRAAAAAFQMQDGFNDVVLTLTPDGNENGVVESVDRVLKPYGGLGAHGKADQFSHRFISNELSELRVFGTVIPGVFLAVTAFLLHLVLSRLISVEREQIGLLKAFGYSSYDVGLHYLKLSIAAIAGGVILGILAGAWLGAEMNELYGEYFHFPIVSFTMPVSVMLWSVLISFAAASIGAMSAVRRAVVLPAAEAMRPEPPADFHSGVLESFGFRKYLSTEERIIVRNLVRRPIKSFMAAIGISLSIALLFVGFYFYDAIDTIISVQFENVQREDVEVSFNDPRPGRAALDLAAMPGVSNIEAYRTVPAILHSSNRTRRTGILGLKADGELRRIVDEKFQVFPIPPEGLVLGETVAKGLQVGVGDRVVVEVTEGSRPVREIEVSAIVSELLGLGTYMDIRALNRLLREGDTISGAFLRVDESEQDKLYSRLKRTPGVSGVGLPKAALASFNDTMAKTIGTMTAFIIGFACVIAFGVVYNGARIALAERGRELASLRVLGFTRNEIARMLLGEQWALTAAAIPIGFLFGLAICFLITRVIDAEIIRLPMVLYPRTFFYSAVIVAAASLVSGLLVASRIKKMDLIAVLKTRE